MNSADVSVLISVKKGSIGVPRLLFYLSVAANVPIAKMRIPVLFVSESWICLTYPDLTISCKMN